MLTRKQIEEKLGQVFSPEQTAALIDILEAIQRAELERATDTRELKQGLTALTTEVRNLAEAQRRTDQRMAELRDGLTQLAEAQRRTAQHVAELAEAQRRTDQRMAELAEAQRRTDQRMAELRDGLTQLAEAQRRTDQHVAELAEAQRRTDESLARLSQVVEVGFRELRQAIGNLSNRFGFDLEEFVAALLPPYLEKHQGITALTLEKRYFDLGGGQVEEVDLAGKGKRAGKPVTVLVECRTTIRGGEAQKLAHKLKAVRATLREEEAVLAIVAMNIHPTAQAVGKTEGVLLIPYSRIHRPGDFD